MLNNIFFCFPEFNRLQPSVFVASSICPKVLKGSYDAISSFAFSLECYKLIVHR